MSISTPHNPRLLQIVVFLSGAVVMSLELAGSRVIAPFLGSSLYVWTSIIGVVLACLSLGYWWGGEKADANPSPELLARCLFISACFVGLSALLEFPLLHLISRVDFDIRLLALLAATLLFGIPAFYLGAVTPIALRLSLIDAAHGGRIAGRLYALSTLGSIAGTFITGYFLFAYIGSSSLLLLLAAVLLFCSLVFAPWHKLLGKVVSLLMLGSAHYAQTVFFHDIESHGLRVRDTAYHRVFIADDTRHDEKRRLLITDPLGTQSIMHLAEPQALAGDYFHYYNAALAQLDPSKPNRVLLLGGGAYSYPKYFLHKYPQFSMDVVEIDPGLTMLAQEFFFLKSHPKLRIFHEDARRYLLRSQERYNAILVDVFRSSPEVPFHLATLEMVREMNNDLMEGGVIAVNMIAALSGEAGQFARAEYWTYKQVFSQVEIAPVRNDNHAEPQNLVMIATNHPLPSLWQELNAYDNVRFKRQWSSEIAHDLPVLTDDFAPVERYLAASERLMRRTEL